MKEFTGRRQGKGEFQEVLRRERSQRGEKEGGEKGDLWGLLLGGTKLEGIPFSFLSSELALVPNAHCSGLFVLLKALAMYLKDNMNDRSFYSIC